MHDLLTKAVEAGARAAQPYAFDDAFWLAKGSPDRHQKHAQANARTAAEAALRAALPGILEAVVGVADPAAQRALVAQILEGE